MEKMNAHEATDKGSTLQNIQSSHAVQVKKQKQKPNNLVKKWAEDLNRRYSK